MSETAQELEVSLAEAEQTETQAQMESIENQLKDLLQQYGTLKIKAHNGQLLKGFRNEKTIYPLAALQNHIDAVEANVQQNLRQITQQLQEQMQYMFQYINRTAESSNQQSATLEAISELVPGLSEAAIEAKIAEQTARKAVEKEAEQDKSNSRQTVARASQDGDTVKISFVGKVDGKEFQGGKGDNVHLKLGSNQFIPGFESQLLGKSAGETVEVAVTFPADYGNAQLAGKAATFTTQVLAVKETVKKEA